jgi:ubiquinol-cytochrome c reductase cytochrome c subunit
MERTMNLLRLATLTLMLALTPLAALAQTATATPAPPGNADTGKKLYNSYGCYQCHGYEGQGSTATGPRLAPRPLPFAAFSRFIRRPPGQMPPYTEKVLSDADLGHIHAYLTSRPMPKPADSIPLLK